MPGFTASQINVKMAADGVDETTSALQKANSAIDQGTKKSGNLLTSFLGIAAGIGAVIGVGDAVSVLTDQLKECVTAATDDQNVQAQLTSVLQSTHDASGMTAQAVADLAEKYSSFTTNTRDAIESSETMLLQFQIGKPVFAQAELQAENLAARLGGDLTTATKTVGKALAEVAAGAMPNLTRAHIVLSAAQKETIKQLEATGQTTKAQSYLLGILQGALGNAAKSAGATFAGQMQILNNKLDETKIAIGNALIPILTELLTAIQPITSAIADLVAKAGPLLAGFIGRVEDGIRTLSPVFTLIKDDAAELAHTFLDELQPGLAAIGNLFKGVHGPAINVNDLFHKVALAGMALYPTVKQLGERFSDFLQAIAPIIPKIGDFIGKLLAAGTPALVVANHMGQLKDLWKTLQSTLSSLMPGLHELGAAFTQNILPAIQTVAPLVLRLAQWLGEHLLPAIQFLIPILGFMVNVLFHYWAFVITAVSDVIRVLVPLIGNLAGWIGDHLGPIIKGVTDLISRWDGWLREHILPIIIQVAGKIGDFIGVLIKLHSWLSDKIMPIYQAIGTYLSAHFGPIIQAIGGFIRDRLTSELQKAHTFISNVFLPVLHTLADDYLKRAGKGFQTLGNDIHTASNLIGTIVGDVNNLINALGRLKNAATNALGGGLGNLGNVLGHLPHFASGGTMPSSGLALVGENGPELAYFPGGTQIYSNQQSKQISGGSGRTVNYYVQTTDPLLVVNELLRQERLSPI